MSGTALAPWAYHPPSEARQRAVQLADALGCPTESSEAMKQCLKTKSAVDITSSPSQLLEWQAFPFFIVHPTREAPGPGAFLDREPEEVYPAGQASDVPFMAGFATYEGCLTVLSEYSEFLHLVHSTQYGASKRLFSDFLGDCP